MSAIKFWYLPLVVVPFTSLFGTPQFSRSPCQAGIRVLVVH